MEDQENNKATEKSYVLYSPVGTSDPIRTHHDGPMLHIIRNYRPRKVYIFLTKAMRVLRDDLNLYEVTINRLCEKLGFECEVSYFEHPEIENPSDYEAFDKIFRKELTEIKEENPDSEILLNITSGAPQMQSALNILSLILPFSTTSIQVRNPVAGPGTSPRVGTDFNCEKEWNELLDNTKEENRCIELENINLNLNLARQNIKSHIKNYDYQAAYNTAYQVSALIGKSMVELLDCIKHKSMLNYKKAQKALKRTDADKKLVYPYSTDPRRSVFEYILYMDNKCKRGEYMDFCRAISPVFTELLIGYFEKLTITSFNDITLIKKDGIRRFDAKRYERTDHSYINKSMETMLRQSDKISNQLLINLIESYIKENIREGDADKQKELDCILRLRKFEMKVRNIAAHQLTDMDEEKMMQLSGRSSKNVLSDIKSLYSAVYGKEEHWDNYEKINDLIESKL